MKRQIIDIPPQDQSDIVSGAQYATLANNVKDLNDDICVELRVVMLELPLLESTNPLTV
jgi:hypothetical protein